jgi:hypothetical protein
MIPLDLQESESALRRAIELRKPEGIEELISSYCRRTNSHLSALKAPDPRRGEILMHVIEVLKWARLMLCLAKADYAAQVTHYQLARRYRLPNAAGSSSVSVDG